ncbi:MAG: type 3 dihydrofolate reductase [Aliidiomarina sp.]|uniref:type 3 dihydrofolate reductase n=1 Tax=Aliidiomarina sp. TaxID=1872439 RepID=UPI0025C417CE|nr:type 3 dihydrofolate reductase [Aliidiomarina sp.]MCH8501346.1 type 3 dihydrofolate reductase [Aliidiomarina sp.]
MHISLIAAMAHNRVIGKHGDMPWHLPGELQYFKSLTIGKPIVMGRKTFESIGRPLSGRHNIVISRTAENLPSEVTHVSSPEAAIRAAKLRAEEEGVQLEELMVIGGGQIYAAFLPMATRLYLTHIDLNVDGDTWFPEYHPEQWQRTLLRNQAVDTENSLAYQGYLYEKK